MPPGRQVEGGTVPSTGLLHEVSVPTLQNLNTGICCMELISGDADDVSKFR